MKFLQARATLIIINLLGGLLVLGSYVWGFLVYPNAGEILWGGVPLSLRPIYTVSMFLAAGGYFAFIFFILKLDPGMARILNRPGLNVFAILFAVILVPSALWLPLTTLAIDHASQLLVWLVRLDLALVALASLGLLFAIINVRPFRTTWLHRLAVTGGILFCFQTVILDAIIWAYHFHL